MRIGDVLLARGLVPPLDLARAVAEREQAGRRLCSLLISRGLLAHDDAARALSEQHGMPGVLLRHLEGREPALAYLIPPALGRTYVALPIGRARGGELIVCVRDPSVDLQRAVEQEVRGAVVLAVTPASRLEQVVAAVYGDGRNVDFDVDLTTGPISLPLVDPHGGGGVPELMLVDLDDARVTKDFTQNGVFGVQREGLPPSRGSAPHLVATAPAGPAPGLPAPARPLAAPAPAPAPTLDATLGALDEAPSRDAATELAMAYIAGRWASSLLVTIVEGAALGHRGHGAQLGVVETIALPMSSPSMLKIAHDTKRVTLEMPTGPIQDRLGRLLGVPVAPAAAPIVVATRAVGAIVVGDSREGVGDVDASSDLEYVAEALGLAYARLLLEAKP